MFATVLTLALLPLAGPEPTAGPGVGYLHAYHADGQGGVRELVRPYVPREGDILYFTDESPVWKALYKVGGTAPPFHAGIVLKRPDGRYAVLESGPDDTLHVFILDIHPRLHRFKGEIQIRQSKIALTPGQSRALTEFALKHEGKRYAMWRLLLQGTPVKTRGGWKEKHLASTKMDRKRWLCAEIVVSAGTLIGIFDPRDVKATCTYPLDILDDSRHDLSAALEPAAVWSPHP